MNDTVLPKIPFLDITTDKSRPKFTMLVGPPGAGKSTYAGKIIDNERTTKYISSDAIRKELFGDENCQENGSEVFTLMQQRTLDALKNGYNVVYDKTNMTRKQRKSILSQLPVYVKKECHIVWAPIEECISRDAARARTVGVDVINRMLKYFEAPFYDEGFDYICVYFSVNYDKAKYDHDTLNSMHIPHDNPYHTLDIYEHCRRCGELLLSYDVPEVVKVAGFLHDIGKPYTKTFCNTKGEPSDTAHYYGHHAVGAWMSYGLYYSDITLAWLISTHMAPFVNKKYYFSLAPLYKKWIDALHEADVAAH